MRFGVEGLGCQVQDLGCRVQGSGFRTIHRAFGRAALRVHVLDARVGTAICRVAVIPAPPRKALAGSIVQAPPLVGAVVFHRAFDRAAHRVRVLDARVESASWSEAVLPAPPTEALAGAVALATSMLVAGT